MNLEDIEAWAAEAETSIEDLALALKAIVDVVVNRRAELAAARAALAAADAAADVVEAAKFPKGGS